MDLFIFIYLFPFIKHTVLQTFIFNINSEIYLYHIHVYYNNIIIISDIIKIIFKIGIN